jgi:hypothetical protein
MRWIGSRERLTNRRAALVTAEPARKNSDYGNIDAAVIRELAFEANTKYVSEAYRTSFAASLLILLRVLAKSIFNRRSALKADQWLIPAPILAFSMFPNERTAIDEHIRNRGVTWSHVKLDIRQATGLDFFDILTASMLRSPRFFYCLVRQYGVGALRRMAYPYLGYSMYCYLRGKFANLDRKGTVVTTNTIHPLSLAIHYAAKAAGWQTIYLEHAMTPKFIAKDRGYSKILLRSSHTREMYADAGIDRDTMEILEYWNLPAAPIAINASTIKSVGFAVNGLDDFKDTEYLVTVLLERRIRCEIRVHDADKRLEMFCAFGTRAGASISSAAGSDITEFIRRQDVVIVGNSSVLLDCLRAGVPAIYFWSGPSDIYDYYGLVTYMRFPSARTREELLRILTP